MRALTLLGPQQRRRTLAAALGRLGVEGRIAAVTAGWQEREAELDEMREDLGLAVVDLELHRRCERAFADDPGLFRDHRARQDRLRAMHRLYRYRLDFALEPARELLRRKAGAGLRAEVLEVERDAAIAAVRELDREYLERIAGVHRAFGRAHPPGSHPALERQRDEVAALVAGSSALVIAGGHVAVLLNRLRLFRVAEMLSDLPVVAWSAGAMALAERVVLFHDSPPQGAGNAEVLDQGLGLYCGLIPLPHARRRLRLEDPCRVRLFARRFAPDLCLPLDEGDAVALGGERPRPGAAPRDRAAGPAGVRAIGATPPRRLSVDGRVEGLAA